MIEKEITQAKQCALTTRDWDTYQIIVRTCLTPARSSLSSGIGKKQAASQAVKPHSKGISEPSH